MLEEELNYLQRLLAQKDHIIAPSRSSNTAFQKFQLAKRKNMKFKMYQEKSHRLPHIHIDYGHENHTASYAIESGERLDGNLPKKYDSDVKNWISGNQEKLVEIWHSVQNCQDIKALIEELQGDV